MLKETWNASANTAVPPDGFGREVTMLWQRTLLQSPCGVRGEPECHHKNPRCLRRGVVSEITDKHTGFTHRDIVYDDVQTFIDEIYTNKTENYTFNEIPRKDWTINDCINVTSELLADTNHHSLTEEPRTIVNIMHNVNVPENLITAFAHEYMERMFVRYGY